jgi:hypothetical protein
MDKFEEQLRNDPAYERGRSEALEDVVSGKLGWKEFGKPVHWWRDAAEILNDEYAIDYEHVSGGITMPDVAAFATGYNEVMNAAIIERFGSDVIEEVFRCVERKQKKLWRQQSKLR